MGVSLMLPVSAHLDPVIFPFSTLITTLAVELVAAAQRQFNSVLIWSEHQWTSKDALAKGALESLASSSWSEILNQS